MANLKSALEVFSKSIVQPLMYLSVAGTVLILGILLTNQTIVAAVPFLQLPVFAVSGKVIYNSLMFIVNNLAVLFCAGIAGAMAKKDKGHATLIGLMSFFLFLNANNIVLEAMGMLAEPTQLGLVAPASPPSSASRSSTWACSAASCSVALPAGCSTSSVASSSPWPCPCSRACVSPSSS